MNPNVKTGARAGRLSAWMLAGAALLAGCGPTTRPSGDAPQARDAGSGEADYRAGLALASGRGVRQDYAQALERFRAAARSGHPGAEYMVGIAYATGRGVAQDHAAALDWFERAARSGHARAQYQLGDAYLNGRGAPRDRLWAARWLGLAGTRGHAGARFDLGVMYAAGLGVDEDPVQAVRWLSLAQQAGHEDAGTLAAQLRAGLAPADAVRASTLAARTPRLGGPPRPDEEPTVRFVQAALGRVGVPAGGVDGIAGPRTRGAIARFRSSQGMPGGETIDDALLSALRARLPGA